jgi:hypothetical protein
MTENKQQQNTGNARINSASHLLTGMIFILAGAFILADNMGYLDGGWFWWLVFSVGVLLMLEAAIRMQTNDLPKPCLTNLIWGAILVGIGANQIYGLDQWWPLILIGTGLIFILNALRGRTKS